MRPPAGPNRWYVFGFTDADLNALGLSYVPQQITATAVLGKKSRPWKEIFPGGMKLNYGGNLYDLLGRDLPFK